MTQLLHRISSRTLIFLGLVFFTISFSARAEIKLPALISDNMVLQQKAKANVWGTADAKEKVTVKIAGKSASAVAGEDGRWSVKFESLKPGGPFEMSVEGSNKITIRNVAVGEVWVCSGQTNMEWRVQSAKNAEQEIADANFPMIRMFTVEHKVSDVPEENCAGKWEVCSPETVARFSAVGYFFGRELHQKLKAPIGLIHSSWGGTPAEAWTSKTALEADPDLAGILERWKSDLEKYPEARAEFDKKMAAWQEDRKKAKAAGEPPPKVPLGAPRGPGHPSTPSGLYHGMIAPLTAYATKGAIWYQGEANASRAMEYRKLFPALIQSWRKAWGQPDWPFLYVQLPGFMARRTEPSESQWAELREAQALTLQLPKTGMAVTIDLGEENNLHPANKQDVGQRLALLAQELVYAKAESSSGPVYVSKKIEGNKVRLTFKNVGGGLVAKSGALKGFAIAGEDKKFVWAEAKIEGQKIVVSSERVSKPVAVRYAWADNPECDLSNKTGLPAAPFRTDDWSAATAE